jgi:cobalamin biosynthesis protein CobT
MNNLDIVCSNNLLEMMNDLNINQNNDLPKSETSKKIKQTKSSNYYSNDTVNSNNAYSKDVSSNNAYSKDVSSKNVSSKIVSSKNVSSKDVHKEESEANESEVEESEADESEADESESEESEESNAEESESEESEKAESDIESVECVPIKNKNGEELWYNPNENIVYRMSGEDGEGVELGYLKKVHKNHHYIFFERKYYTVVKQVCNNYECVFSKNIFDENMSLI